MRPKCISHFLFSARHVSISAVSFYCDSFICQLLLDVKGRGHCSLCYLQDLTQCFARFMTVFLAILRISHLTDQDNVYVLCFRNVKHYEFCDATNIVIEMEQIYKGKKTTKQKLIHVPQKVALDFVDLLRIGSQAETMLHRPPQLPPPTGASWLSSVPSSTSSSTRASRPSSTPWRCRAVSPG